jgi:hypothetical protein
MNQIISLIWQVKKIGRSKNAAAGKYLPIGGEIL